MRLEVAEVFPPILAISPVAGSRPELIIKDVLSKISVALFADTVFCKANHVVQMAGEMLKAREQLPPAIADIFTSNSHLVSLQTLRPMFTVHALSEFCFSSDAPLKDFFIDGNWKRISMLPKDFAEDVVLLDSQLKNAEEWTDAWMEVLAAAVDIDGHGVTASDYRCMLKVLEEGFFCGLRHHPLSHTSG
jgi:hypothetical protein